MVVTEDQQEFRRQIKDGLTLHSQLEYCTSREYKYDLGLEHEPNYRYKYSYRASVQFYQSDLSISALPSSREEILVQYSYCM